MHNNKFRWAIVSGRLTQYQEGTLEHYLSEYDNKTPMVRWISPFGVNSCTPADNFIEGTYEELQAIINEWDHIHKEKVKDAISRMPLATPTEKIIIEYMIGDGYEPDELTYREVKYVTENTIRYMDWNSSLSDAYMDYMH